MVGWLLPEGEAQGAFVVDMVADFLLAIFKDKIKLSMICAALQLFLSNKYL